MLQFVRCSISYIILGTIDFLVVLSSFYLYTSSTKIDNLDEAIDTICSTGERLPRMDRYSSDRRSLLKTVKIHEIMTCHDDWYHWMRISILCIPTVDSKGWLKCTHSYPKFHYIILFLDSISL